MFEKQQFEKILSTHGLTAAASDDEIRHALVQADWHTADIEAALLVLREDPNQHRTHQDALHQLYRTDERLRPETIKSLLGIDMQITSADVIRNRRRNRGVISFGQILEIVLVSCVLGTAAIFAGMWIMKVGIFHVVAL